MKTIAASFVLLFFGFAAASGADSPKVVAIQVTGHGRPIIFIPGLATPGAIWDDIVRHFQDRFECHIVTIAGFGGAPPAKSEHLLADVRDQLIAYAREKKLQRPLIVGHSLGGTIALEIAASAPEVPADLVLVDSLPFLAAIMAPGVQSEEDAKRFAAPLKASIEKNTPEQFAAYQRDFSIPNMVTKPSDVARVAEICGRSDPATVAEAMFELLTVDLRPQLARIKCPVLVLGALADKLAYAPREALEANYRNQYSKLEQARFQFFEKSKHFIFVDEPDAFVRALESELSRQP